MKTIQKASARLAMLFLGALLSMVGFAQEKSTEIDVNINKDGGGANWYASPWVWIIGAAVFILLLVALLRGSGSRE
jgi:hypothetical protein